MTNGALPLVETIAVPDIFVSGLSSIEDIGGGMIRLTMYALQRNPITHGMERAIVCKVVCHESIIAANCDRTKYAVASHQDDFEDGTEFRAAH
jgi:hypothetical protein